MTNAHSPADSAHVGVQPMRRGAIALTMLTAALWGGTPVAVSFSAASLPPVMIAAIRFSMALVFMVFWCGWERTSIRLRPGQLKLAVMAAVLLFLQIATFNVGVDWSNSSHGSMLINTFVFWVVLMEHYITRGDRVTHRKLAGLLLATFGVITILIFGESASPLSSSDDLPTPEGDLVLLFSAMLLAIRVVYVKHALRSIEPGKLIFWHDVIGVMLFFGYSMALEDVAIERLTMPAVWGLLYQGVVVAGFCFALHARLLRNHSASQISVFSFATPLFGVAFAILLRDDPFSSWLLLSAACVTGGIYLVNSKR